MERRDPRACERRIHLWGHRIPDGSARAPDAQGEFRGLAAAESADTDRRAADAGRDDENLLSLREGTLGRIARAAVLC